jgi:ABC-type glycerol-3-phosphate transport system substrate-binding protein
MKRISRRQFLKSTGVASLGLSLAACVAPTAAPAGSSDSGAAAAPEQRTVTFWCNFGAQFAPIVDEFEGMFEEAYPDIALERQDLGTWDEMREKTLTAFAASTGPDTFRIAVFDTAMYATRDSVIALDDYVQADMGTEVFIDGFLANVMYDGKMWAMPWKGSAVAFFWNKDLFEQAGLDPETPPTTWDEIIEMAGPLTDVSKQQFGFLNQYTDSAEGMNFFGPILYSWQAELFDSLDPAAVTKAAFNTENGVDALQWVLDVMAAEVCNPAGLTIQNAQMNNLIGMWHNGQWDVGNIKSINPELNYGTTVLPASPFGIGTTVTGGDHIAISSVCKDVDAAWTFLSWANTPEVESWFWPQIGGLPGRKEVAETEVYATAPFDAFMKQLEQGAKPRPGVPDITEILHEIMVQVQFAQFGEKDPATALTDAEVAVNRIIERRLQSG